jgi:hypothetical protein
MLVSPAEAVHFILSNVTGPSSTSQLNLENLAGPDLTVAWRRLSSHVVDRPRVSVATWKPSSPIPFSTPLSSGMSVVVC